MTMVVRPCISLSSARLHQRLAFGVERRGRLVEQQDRRVAQDGAGNRDALALAAGQRHAALADLAVIALFELQDELVGLRILGRRLDLGIAGARPAEADIVARACREDGDILRHDGDARRARLRDRPRARRRHRSTILPVSGS